MMSDQQYSYMSYKTLMRVWQKHLAQDLAESQSLLLELGTSEPTLQQCFKIIESTCLSQGLFCSINGTECTRQFQKHLDAYYIPFLKVALWAIIIFGFISLEFVLTPMPRLEIETIQDFKILYEIGALTPDMSVELSRILLGNASKPQNQFNMRSKNENSGMNQNTGQESKKRKGFGNDDSDAQKRVARPCWPSMNRIQIEDSWKMWPINTIVFTPSFRAFLSIHKKRADSFQRIRQMPLAQNGSMIAHRSPLCPHAPETHPNAAQQCVRPPRVPPRPAPAPFHG